jgi:hypothetical protein
LIAGTRNVILDMAPKSVHRFIAGGSTFRTDLEFKQSKPLEDLWIAFAVTRDPKDSFGQAMDDI